MGERKRREGKRSLQEFHLVICKKSRTQRGRKKGYSSSMFLSNPRAKGVSRRLTRECVRATGLGGGEGV